MINFRWYQIHPYFLCWQVLDLIEFAVNDDKDRKIILTLINIENSKPSDFSFGIYSLLLCLSNTAITRFVKENMNAKDFEITEIVKKCIVAQMNLNRKAWTIGSICIFRIPFSTKLWFCIWEYEQLTTSNYLKYCLKESIPNLSHLVSMNLSYIATDQAVYLLSKHCPSLEDLCLDHSSVSDRCARFFCEYEKTSSSQVRKYLKPYI